MKRIYSLDILRGLTLMFVVFFHTAVYNFANIHKLDFSDPPLVIILISFLILWGGIFIIYSTLINTYMLVSRIRKGGRTNHLRNLIIAGVLYVVIHFLLTVVFGRWSVDMENNQPNLTLVAGSIRQARLVLPEISKYFEGSSLSIIALNLIVVSSLVSLLMRGRGFDKDLRNYLALAVSGTLIMLLSFVRVPLYPLMDNFIYSNQYLPAALFSFFVANPYPAVPYLAYGLFGSLLGLIIFKHQFGILKKMILPLGSVFLVYGLWGMSQFEKTISKADYFWYFKTHFELGLFLVVLTLILLIFQNTKKPAGILTIPYWFSRVCLTVYLFETFISEILRMPLLTLVFGWDQTINGCLMFGGLNIIIWTLILYLWKKKDFKYSLEYFWVKIFATFDKQSTKLEET